jgi:hypothetical protein
MPISTRFSKERHFDIQNEIVPRTTEVNLQTAASESSDSVRRRIRAPSAHLCGTARTARDHPQSHSLNWNLKPPQIDSKVRHNLPCRLSCCSSFDGSPRGPCGRRPSPSTTSPAKLTPPDRKSPRRRPSATAHSAAARPRARLPGCLRRCGLYLPIRRQSQLLRLLVRGLLGLTIRWRCLCQLVWLVFHERNVRQHLLGRGVLLFLSHQPILANGRIHRGPRCHRRFLQM